MIHSSNPRLLASAGLCVLAAAALYAPIADAATQRTINVSATGICDAPLPVFNTQLRRRPVAVQNESDRSVFVSCTLPTDSVGLSNTGSVQIGFRNAGAATATISCTMVSGTSGAQVYYVPKDQPIVASGRATIAWDRINKWSTPGTYAFSCTLPPQVAMETITYTQTTSGDRL